MKRYGNLWHEIIAFSNLLKASQQAQRGKRFRENVLKFNYSLEQELFHLQAELQSKAYLPGDYTTFQIFEPKPRMISAAPYRDRVVHHALCNVIVPIFERTFISDSYANRIGFGSHRALRRFTKFARSSRYVLQADIQKYFPSIDHEILKSFVYSKIKCPDTLWLINTLVDSSNPQEPVINYFPGDDLLMPLERRHGLPIGNLTSQFFANVYLNGFDHFVKEQIKAAKYIRYVDDFALFSDDKAFLQNARVEIENYLAGLRVKIHPVKSQLFETKYGANFVGFRILPDRIRVRNDSLRQGRQRLRQMFCDYHAGEIGYQEISESTQSWVAHLKHGNTWHLRQQIFRAINPSLQTFRGS
ncbi:RNA-directed DNA polymerase [Nostocaceae cyanobacterium CENA357]|uniref:RNA-directed DNA polymerase n=1 Tax=Atlanticothrix silvestris CENA357 TaxID=1725252 RepID=A0A8J7L6Y6_9CYAN|nr:RNA-directed DNA polymerase [Atlanticothrix silvestris]MBH8556202.1 RNA-directed DNA polymerase [Atlanticothrix silvestris CENA357]